MVNYLGALRDFNKMRRRADLERLMARLRGQSADLLEYDKVRAQLRARGSVDLGEQDVPLDAIVGSVNRHMDFSRTFLPRRDSDANRWAKVDMAVTGEMGLDPIDVYQIGDAYFVLDGNHRVSVARWHGATHIAARVVEVRTLLPLSPDDRPDDLILKARLADFLEKTGLAADVDPVELAMTSPGGYRVLLEDIEVTQCLLQQEEAGRTPPDLDDAAHHWLVHRYQPAVALMRERGMLHHFPDRTETDLYAWVVKHQSELADELQWRVDIDMAVIDLHARYGGSTAAADSGSGEVLLQRVLLPMSDSEVSMHALDLAVTIARRSEAMLYGLRVRTPDEQANEPSVTRTRFEHACRVSGVACEFAVADGPVAQVICDRARWADLVVTGLRNPPEPSMNARLRSGLGAVLRRCSRPVLAVPPVASALEAALVAYDGSANARQAVVLAAYLAGYWSMSLAVVVVQDNAEAGARLLAEATRLLAGYQISAAQILKSGETASAILAAAEEAGADLIVMGGYGHRGLIEVALGSTVDAVVRAMRYPVLICR